MPSSFVWFAIILPAAAAAQGAGAPPPAQKPPVVVQEKVEVVATRLPEAPHDVAAPIEVLTGDELRNRGAVTLRDALSLAAGIEIAPGGDAGPASFVPEFWGLREFDAFLLVVDDVPWGGAFNPALTSLNLHDVERIEILRGAAPVTYGATSFVGVIHVVHKPAAADRSYVDARGGTLKSGGASVDLALRPLGKWRSRLTADFDRQGFADSRTSYSRGHALFRSVKAGADRRMWFTADVNVLRQDPASPHPVDEEGLSPDVPLDANANPAGAFMNDDRLAVAFGLDRPMKKSLRWVTTASFTRSMQRSFRGFLNTIADQPGNATGLRENITLTDLYADSHFVWPVRPHVQFLAGGDFLHGKGNSTGATFDYTTPLNASAATVVAEPATLDLGNEDRREFAGGYAMMNWTPTPRVTVSTGIRANVTFEERGGSPAEEAAAKAAGEKDHGQMTSRPSGSAAVLFGVWERGVDHVRVYANYRGTFKPAAFDFGLGESGGIDPDKTLLKPETAQSVDGGAKIRMLGGRLDLEADAFRMDFHNLVTSTTVNGLPALQNSGTTRFQGVEVATDLYLAHDVSARATYSFHDGRYVSFVKIVDAGPTELGGNRFEMSARHLAAAGLAYAPSRGLRLSGSVKFVGNRYLDEINSVLAPAYATVDLGGGYRADLWEVRVDGRNLGNRRDAASLSELGDGQVYRVAAREAVFSVSRRF